ncbi:hypothetical protein SUGI_0449710 [Cryptomeria japonica]|nr:hypothetical protein SUGI_0449710 [Cryptomeria japonica]
MTNRPHALMLAFPTRGHIKPMMQFAKIVSARGFQVAFVNTENMHEKMLKSGSIQSMGGINFETIPDGLPPQHGRTSQIDELCKSITNNCSPHFEKVIDKLNNSPDVPPLSCIVYNGLMSWAQKSAKRLGIPGVSFWTASACGFNIYFSMPLLVEKRYIPLKGMFLPPSFPKALIWSLRYVSSTFISKGLDLESQQDLFCCLPPV